MKNNFTDLSSKEPLSGLSSAFHYLTGKVGDQGFRYFAAINFPLSGKLTGKGRGTQRETTVKYGLSTFRPFRPLRETFFIGKRSFHKGKGVLKNNNFNCRMIRKKTKKDNKI